MSYRQQALDALCAYDPRNPERMGDEDGPFERKEPCYCDNCHEGRHKLAETILALLDDRDRLKKRLIPQRKALLAILRAKTMGEMGAEIFNARKLLTAKATGETL